MSGKTPTPSEDDIVLVGDLADRIISLCPDAIIGVDQKGIINIFNRAAERITGWSQREVIGEFHIGDIYASYDIARLIKKSLLSTEFGGIGRLEGFETEGRTRDGRRYPVRLSAIVLYKDGIEVGSVGFFYDLTERKSLEEELRRLSITDSLTGLYNHRHFVNVLADEVGRAKRYQRPLTIIYFDLDDFKLFNDAFGHREGDRLLCLASECTRGILRVHDYAFRHGGDEFMLLLVETNFRSGVQVAERFRESFNKQCHQASSKLSQTSKRVSISLGVAQLLPGEDIDALITRADLAMYEAKRAGGDRIIGAESNVHKGAARIR
ncbi:MAG: diguanylate cyclase [Deltaproteobacteria bacterium]|nr:diguanylate cyclase [Deltaproteobacteria bacterium]